VALDSVVIRGVNPALNVPLVVTCLPQSEAIPLGTITQGGVALSVDADDPARQGGPVTLSTLVAPATGQGFVEFRDGDDTIGVVPVVDGGASLSTTALAAGAHVLTARYFGNSLGAHYTSNDILLTVLPQFDCSAFTDAGTDAGNGAVVRLVYLELLGRCPDQAGYDHWVARLYGYQPGGVRSLDRPDLRSGGSGGR